MEHLFSPCTRLQDLLENQIENQGNLGGQGRNDFEWLQELNLDVSTEELLSAERAFTFADFYAMLVENGNAVLWLTPYTAFIRSNGRSHGDSYGLQVDDRFQINVDGKGIHVVTLSSEDSSVICDVVLRLLAASVDRSVNSIVLKKSGHDNGAWINAPASASLMQQCQSLKSLTSQNLEIDEILRRVLGAYSRPDLDIVLCLCTSTSAGTSALAEVLGSIQGPTNLESCDMDYSILADGLRGNSRLKSSNPSPSPRVAGSLEDDTREVLAMAGALQENKGLVQLILHHRYWSVETGGAICDSLKTHPTLEILRLKERYVNAAVAPAVLKSRIQALADMLKVNRTIEPYLKTNRFRPRVRAIQKTRPMMLRAKVLGQALLAARNDPNRSWMLLSENVDVVFPSTTATTTPATAVSQRLPLLPSL
jgi:hypothetical protein